MHSILIPSFWAHFAPFLVQKLEEKGIPKKFIHFSFKSLCCYNCIQLNQKSPMKNLISDPLWTSFCPKTSKQVSKSFRSISSLHATANICKKKFRKFRKVSIFQKIWKISVWTQWNFFQWLILTGVLVLFISRCARK